MSVILITKESYDTLRVTMGKLRDQTISQQLEVVILATAASQVKLDDRDAGAFHSVRVIQYDGPLKLSMARLAGIREAKAPFVALGEDHCFPEPLWAEAMLARLREGYAAVGPEMVNANPFTARSWVSFITAYGGWAQPMEAGETDSVAGHNCSYDREVLLSFGDDLEGLLAAETVLHWQMRDAGHKVFSEPKAKTHHTNISGLPVFLESPYHGSRVFAGVWVGQLSPGRRIYFTLISFLIAFRRMGSMMRVIQKQPPGTLSRVKVVPLIAVAMMLIGLGYTMGFAFGPGGSRFFSWGEELNRRPLLCKSDQRWFDTLQPHGTPIISG
jgi:hypothetical protein